VRQNCDQAMMMRLCVNVIVWHEIESHVESNPVCVCVCVCVFESESGE